MNTRRILMGLLLAVLLCAAVLPGRAEAVTEYDLWVCGQRVTSANKDSIAGGVTYDPDTATLRLNNVKLTAEYNVNTEADFDGRCCAIYARIPLQLELTGSSTITALGRGHKAAAVYTNGETLTVSGSGSLIAEAVCRNSNPDGFNCGKLILNGGTVTLRGINESGAATLAAYGGNFFELTVNGGTLTAVGTCRALTILNGYFYRVPQGYQLLAARDPEGTDLQTVSAAAFLSKQTSETPAEERYRYVVLSVPADTRSVTFDANGHGTAPAPQYLQAGTAAYRPADLEEKGYAFRGWFTDKFGTQEYDFAKPVTENMTLYAGWTERLDGLGVWVGGQEITGLNKNNIPGLAGGSGSYDPATGTLTLNGARVLPVTYAYESGSQALIYADGDLTIRGSGEIAAKNTGIEGVRVKGALTIDADLTVDVSDCGLGADRLEVLGGETSVCASLGTGVRPRSGMTLSGGSLSVKGYSWGIHITAGDVTVTGGQLTVSMYKPEQYGHHGIANDLRGKLVVTGGAVDVAGRTAAYALKDGAELGPDMAVLEPADAPLGKDRNGYYTYMDGADPAKHVVIGPKLRVMKDVNVTITAPLPGKTPDFAPVLPEGTALVTDYPASGYVHGVRWRDTVTNEYLSAEDTFEPNREYNLRISMTAVDPVRFSVSGGENDVIAAVNGVEAAARSLTADPKYYDESVYINLSVIFLCPDHEHVPGETVRENEVPATCASDGSYDEVVYCTVCGAELSRGTKTAAKLAHTPGEEVKENEVPATCTAMGSYDKVVYCTVCGEQISRTATAVPTVPHDWGEQVVTKEPTDTESGAFEHTCKVCGTKETGVIGFTGVRILMAAAVKKEGYTAAKLEYYRTEPFTVLLAAYDENGRFLSAQTAETYGEFEDEGVFVCKYVEASRLVFFVYDSATHVPLGASMEVTEVVER